MARIDGYEIDATESQEHVFDSEVTAFPVEAGADDADHIREKPEMITLACVVSNTPIGPIAAKRTAGAEPVVEAHQRLIAIKKARRRVEVETVRGLFEGMAMTGLTEPVAADDGKSLRFRATFQQLRVITNERTTVRVAVPAAKKHVNRGAKIPKSISDPIRGSIGDEDASHGYQDSWIGKSTDALGITDGPGATNIGGENIDTGNNDLRALAAAHSAGLI